MGFNSNNNPVPTRSPDGSYVYRGHEIRPAGGSFIVIWPEGATQKCSSIKRAMEVIDTSITVSQVSSRR